MSTALDRIEYRNMGDVIGKNERRFINECLQESAQVVVYWISTESLREAKKRARKLGIKVPHRLITRLNKEMRETKYGDYDVALNW